MTVPTVVCWKWKPVHGYRSKFGPESVNVLYRSVKRNFAQLQRFVCVTDDASGLDPAVDVVPIWSEWADIPSPHGGRNPSCYRRLRAFSPEAKELFGGRFVSLDLDTVVLGDLTPLWDRPEDFVCWGETQPKSFYNGSMFLMTAGARRQVFETFDPSKSPHEAKAAGKFGSDQGWLSYCLGKGEATWTTADGVYSYNVHLRRNGNTPPANARIVMFHGGTDPWSPEAMKLPWVKQAWR